jgi:hypothetical protein
VTDDQIDVDDGAEIGRLGGREDSRPVPRTRDQRCDLLQVEGEVWWPRSVGRQAVEGARG